MKKVLICKKLGMTEYIGKNGKLSPVTVLEPIPTILVEKKSVEKDGYQAIKIAYGNTKEKKKCNKPHIGQFKKRSLDVYKSFCEFRVEAVEGFEIGKGLALSQFEENEEVSVSGKTKGRGFTGTIKRWNFQRGPMTHGSKSHRITGSIGGGTTPGRVLKGKKMAGHYGNEKVTISGLKIIKIDNDKNIILVSGAVPGHQNTHIVITS